MIGQPSDPAEFESPNDQSDRSTDRDTPERFRASINALLEVSGEDAKRVTAVSSFSLVVAAFPLKESGVGSQADWVKIVGVLGLIFLAIAAGLLWIYASQVTYSRMSIARCLVNSDWKRAWARWSGTETGVKARYGIYYKLGTVCLIAGFVTSAVAIGQSILHF